jgi:hypothetical protein
MADSDFGQNVLGSIYLPASPLYPAQNLTAGAGAPPPWQGAAPVPDPSPVASAPVAAGGGAPPWLAGLMPQPRGGVFGPGTGRVMSALGAGLSSAGQNWNKPGAAAFAAGAGAALQGGQQFDHQVQDARLKALQTAIAAFKVGDMAAFHQATVNLRALNARQQQSAAAPPSAASPAFAAAAANNPPAPVAAPGSTSAAGLSAADAIAQARSAIARGAPPDAVRQRLDDHGFDSSGL